MKPMSFATTGFERYAKKTRRQAFLEDMERVVPWSALSALVEEHYPKGEVGRPPVGVERMLRIMFLQHWFNLSDPGVEEALYDTPAMRVFARIDLGRERVPDETTICKFRHLIERCDLSGSIFDAVALHLADNGIVVRSGTIVDATILDAPSSTKNRAKERDPEMHQTKKGNQWYFGAKGHIGVDSKTKVIHSVVITAANVHDSQMLPELLHGGETRVWGDSAYIGQRDAISSVAPKASAFINKRATRNHPLSEEDLA
jgi:IS5 family transposase